jgi:hypothetical protein
MASISTINFFDLLDDIIILKIFSYLPIKKLNKLSQVCSKWSHLIHETKLTRKHSIYFTLLNSNKWIYNQTARNFRMSKEDFVQEFTQDLTKLNTQPEIFIYFLTHHFNDKCIIEPINQSPTIVKRSRRSFRVKDDEKLSHITEVISSLLPKESIKLFFFPSNIIGTNFSQTLTLDYDIDAISGLLLPKSTPNYRIDIRKVSAKDKLNTFTTKNDLYEYLGIDSNFESLKYMLVIVGSPKRTDLKEFLKFLNKLRLENNDSNNFCVSGGFIFDKSNLVTLLNIISNKNDTNSVQLGQIIVPDLDRSEFDIYFDNKLKLLQKNAILSGLFKKSGGNSFVLKINCIGRGTEYHGMKDHELDLFRKYFKSNNDISINLPLIGFYGEGEIGHEYLPYLNLVSDSIDLYSYSSIFTLIHLS